MASFINDVYNNYAATVRGLNASDFVALAIPRNDFSFFIELVINPRALSGTIEEAKRYQRVTAAVKSVTKPQFSFDIETIRRYNSHKHIKKKMEWNDVTLTLFDDATSYMAGLLKMYRAHYTYQGLQVTPDEARYVEPPFNAQSTSSLPKRIDDRTLPSMGLRINDVKFFEEIRIFDLGSEPASVNVYRLVDPLIKDVSMGTLDYSGSGVQEIGLTLSYKHSIDHIGVNIFDPIHTGSNIKTSDGIEKAFGHEVDPEDQSSSRSRGGTWQNNNTIEQSLEDLRQQIQDQIQDDEERSLIKGLIGAVQKSIQGGELNTDDLAKNIFSEISKGTPLQDLREVYKSARQIEQAIRQGRYTDVIGLLSEIAIINSLYANTLQEPVNSAIELIDDQIENGKTWLSQHLNFL